MSGDKYLAFNWKTKCDDEGGDLFPLISRLPVGVHKNNKKLLQNICLLSLMNIYSLKNIVNEFPEKKLVDQES